VETWRKDLPEMHPRYVHQMFSSIFEASVFDCSLRISAGELMTLVVFPHLSLQMACKCSPIRRVDADSDSE